jgi:hypothetical protein
MDEPLKLSGKMKVLPIDQSTGKVAQVMHFCECENEIHHSDEDMESNKRPDPRDPNHCYCPVLPLSELVEVRTIYGNWQICHRCIKDHPMPAHFLRKDGE